MTRLTDGDNIAAERLFGFPHRRTDVTPEDMHGPTLVDCGCQAKVYADGSGIEIEYCPLHGAARDLLEALGHCLNIMQHPYVGEPMEAELPAWYRILDEARAAIAKAGG